MYPPTEDQMDPAMLPPEEMFPPDEMGLVPQEDINLEEEEQEVNPEDIYPKEVTDALLRIKDNLTIPERSVREAYIKRLKKLECYWNNLQYIYWDAIARDYRDYQDRTNVAFEDPQGDTDVQAIAKVVNIYKAHGQAWISAIAAGVPYVRFFPDDADNASDVQTAKAYSKISELIQRHNQSELLFLRALYLLFNTGVVFAYNELKTRKEFGTFREPIPGQETLVNRTYFCPACGAPSGEEPAVDPKTAMPPPEQQCQSCGVVAPPEIQDQEETFDTIVGYNDRPKSREVLRVFGPLHVEVPHYISKLDETPYLRFVTEEPVGLIQETYPEFAHLIKASYDTDEIERWARNDRRYAGEWQDNVVTVARMWFRPWAFNAWGDTKNEIVQLLKKEYPEGCYCVIINNDLIVEILPDVLDDHWTATLSPFSEHIHAEPEGQSLVPIQDMTNELSNITLETIEFGIPETFADPSVLDFENYSKSEARPGMVNQAKAPSGQNLSAGFHDIKAASLSQEVEMFADRLDSAAQFVVGTFPTIYGGAIEGGSGTAREYELSRAQALQRLSGTWTVLKIWWSQVMSKSVRSFAKNMIQDEKFVKEQGQSFVNTWIRKAELQGKVGEIEPETSEAFPISWAQKRDVLLQLIQMQDPQIGAIFMHPENTSFVAELIGMEDLYIPGDDDRNKQLIEIAQLIQGQPNIIGIDPMTGQEQFQSSVPVDMEVDRHEIEAEICLSWLKSPVGMDTKESNPAAWMNVRAHYMEHSQIMQMQMQMQQQAAAQAEGGEGEAGAEGDVEPPAEGDVMADDDMDILNDVGDPANAGEQGTSDSTEPEVDDDVVDDDAEGDGEVDDEGEEEDEAPEGEGEPEGEEKPQGDPAVEGRPTYQELKKADPDIFKKVPELKDIFFREQKFSETFQTVEEAQVAARESEDFDVIEASLLNGDPSLVFQQLARNAPQSVPLLVDNFLPAIQRLSKDLYVRATMPVLEDLIRITYNDGKRLNDKNLMYAAGHIAKHVFGEPRIPEPRTQSTGPHPAEVQLREERNRHFNERYGSFNFDLATESYTRLERIADRGINDPEGKLNGFTRKAITKEALAELDERLGGDQQLNQTLRQLWKRATVGGFTKEHKEAILNAHLSRAKQLLPGIRNRMVAEALGQKVAKNGQQRQKRDIPSGGRGAAGGNRMGRINPRTIDWSKTSDEDILAGKVTTRK